MKLRVLKGTNEIGGTCIEIRHLDTSILLDVGMPLSPDSEPVNVKALNPDALCNVAIGTTRWIMSDSSSDLKGIVSQIADVPILAADIDFRHSKFDGLKAYEKGIVKEGVGAGGAAIAAMAKLGGAVTKDMMLKEIERNFALLMGTK